MKPEMKTDDMVYVRAGNYWEAAKVDYFFHNTRGEICVAFYGRGSANRRDVITYDEYWQHQRDSLAAKCE